MDENLREAGVIWVMAYLLEVTQKRKLIPLVLVTMSNDTEEMDVLACGPALTKEEVALLLEKATAVARAASE